MANIETVAITGGLLLVWWGALMIVAGRQLWRAIKEYESRQ